MSKPKSLKVIIKVMMGERVVDYESLTDEEKKDIGRRLNHQGLTALGYVPDDKT